MKIKFMLKSVNSWHFKHLKSLKVVFWLELIYKPSKSSSNIKLSLIFVWIIIKIRPNWKSCLASIFIGVFKCIHTYSESMLWVTESKIRSDRYSYHNWLVLNIVSKDIRNWVLCIIKSLDNNIKPLSPSLPKWSWNVLMLEFVNKFCTPFLYLPFKPKLNRKTKF